MKSTVVALCLILVSGATAAAQQSRLDSLLDSPPFDNALWGVLIEDEEGAVIYEHHADRLFMPASNNKLVVAAAAAHMLPASFRASTSVYGTGNIEDGVLLGDLVVYGTGDPTYSERCYYADTTREDACETMWSRMDNLADLIAGRGIRLIAGGIVGDGSYFEPTLVHPSWEVYDINWWYAAPVSGLAFNDNSINVTWGPGPSVGSPVEVLFEPELDLFVFENRAVTVEADGNRTIDFFRKPGSSHIWSEGAVPEGYGERTEYFALPDPNLYFARALREALSRKGISVAGPTSSTVDSMRFRHVRNSPALATLHSRPLRDMIYPILNSSQNLFAEMLLKTLGRELGESGSWRDGAIVARRFLIETVGIDSVSIHLSDGSGLSTGNLITPRALVSILRFMLESPGRDIFLEGLPAAGGPGSLRSRFLDSPLEGRLRAKTGSIFHVNSLSGYYLREDGSRAIFSIILNNHAGSYSEAVDRIDTLLIEAVSP